MTTKSMKSRLRRVAAQAAEKKATDRAATRRRLIARLEKDATDVKSRSFPEDNGGSKGTAADEFDRKKTLPKTKGDDANMDYDWEPGEGYPHAGNDASLGKGDPKLDAKKQKQKALDEASEENAKNTSDMEWSKEWDKRPRPKLSGAERRQWRRKRIAELKQALTSKEAFNPEGDPEMKKMFSDMEADDARKREEEAAKNKSRAKGIAPKEQRIQALKIQQFLSRALPRLQEKNSDLEMAVTGGKAGEMLQLLSPMTKLLAAIAGRAAALERALAGAAKTASKNDYKKVVARHAQLQEEVARSRTLIRLAANHIRL